MTITAHTLVKNEARFVWFAVMSVIEHIDRVLLWDTGSTDGTVEICKEIEKRYPSKVDFREVGEVTPETFTEVRQQMLDATYTDWFLVVDGDEIWWAGTIRYLLSEIEKQGDKIESIVVPTINLIGDIFHFQEEAAGRYGFGKRVGHYNLRAANRNIPGLQFKKPHGQLGIYDKNNVLIQNRDLRKRVFLDSPYLHFTNVQRSTHREKDLLVPKRAQKLKYELGISFPADFYYPEVFFRERPSFIPSPWEKRNKNYILRALMEFPFKYSKRRLGIKRVGY